MSNPTFKPYIDSSVTDLREFSWRAIVVGSLLGIIFGASSMYLVLKVGLTISASIPVAVLSIALFRFLSPKDRTILESNIAQTAGSAGESIAFGVGLIMPTLLLMGQDIDVVRTMTVGILGGILGILMMIPLRRAFIVGEHGKLKYPEGTACAEVLKAGELGGTTAKMLAGGFGLGFIYQTCMKALGLWKEEAEVSLAAAKLKGGVIGMEVSPALLGVGYIIGPRIACIMVAGGVLAYLVLVPMIKYFGDGLALALPPAAPGKLIKDMEPSQIRNNYILYIGAGAVAAGGIISMIKALPVIFGALIGTFMGRKEGQGVDADGTQTRTERDLPVWLVLVGSLALILILMAVPQLNLGFSGAGLAGALMILVFGFLFVTVSARLTGEIGSSSNPISGMTVATLLLTCLILLGLESFGVVKIDLGLKLTALTIAGVVCIASSNGGTTAQALKTGHLIGATPISQQLAILIGSLTSAAVVGLTLLAMNSSGTTYSKLNLPKDKVDVTKLVDKDHVHSGAYSEDTTEYHVLRIAESQATESKIPPGKYFVNDAGEIAYLVDPAINGRMKEDDQGKKLTNKFDAPKSRLMQLIIDGVLENKLPWDLVMLGILIALTLELASVPSLPFAVGVYLPLAASTPIFVGGVIRWFCDKLRRVNSDADSDTSSGVLLASGYIAGGSIAALLIAFANFSEDLVAAMNLSHLLPKEWNDSILPAVIAFGILGLILLIIGGRRDKPNQTS
jgi:putative OPT family oligopeptide transporter